MVKRLVNSLRAWWGRLVLEVKVAREPAPAIPPVETFAVKTPGTDEVIVLPKQKIFTGRPPTQDEIRADGRRMALAYARSRVNNPELTWKQAKPMLDRWEKEERDMEHRKQAALRAVTGAIDKGLNPIPFIPRAKR